MKTGYQLIKELFLIVGGALLGILAVPFESQILYNITPLILITLFMLLFGFGLFDWFSMVWLWIQRRWISRRKIIGIYAPFEIQAEENASWIEVKTNNIVNLLNENKYLIKVEKGESAFKKHIIIINPFGGVYPEKDLSHLKSLEVVFNFVRNGGIYLNIADIPFYYAYDEMLDRRIDTTPLAGDFSIQRSFFHTLLTRKLHCFVLGITDELPDYPDVKRVIQLPRTEDNLIENINLSLENFDFSPVLKIAYGKGYFIFSTLRIDSNNLEQNLIRLVNAALDIQREE